MCAISGIVNWLGTKESDKTKVITSLAAMEYRGPDFSAIQQREFTVLGHNRLAIVDLNPRSNQPMTTIDNRYTIVFNGEIYNYTTLKNDLKSQGIAFNSTSDTEVILKGFVKYGNSFIAKLRGMFAFSIWDEYTKEMLLARDRFGEKPFYYMYEEGLSFAFASNLSGIVALTNQKLNINKQAVYELLSQQYITNESCIYDGIKKLAPGHYMTITASNCVVNSYWQLDYSDKLDLSYEESKNTVHQLISESVSEQLIADVPVGLFLSGGVDSSIIAAVSSKKKKDITAITMSTPDDKKFDEAEAASFIAIKLKINHKIVFLDKSCVNELPYILKNIEPLADVSLIPTMAIAREAKNDFKVMLSGDGGDEIFGGYKQPVLFNQTNFKETVWSKRLASLVVKNTHYFPFNYLESKINDERIYKWGGLDTYFSKLILQPRQGKKILKTTQILKNSNEFYLNQAINFTSDEADKLLYVGVKSKLVGDFLYKMDSGNMHAGIESRAPFLDHRIVDFTAKLRIKQLMPNGIDKEILKSIGTEYLPKEVFLNPKKGFSIPYYEYLKTSWGILLEKFIKEGISSELGLIEPNCVLELVKIYRLKPSFKIGKLLYSILVFEIWLRVFHLKMDPNEINLNV
ncbi:asparagine synthase (glutamine-hydrolyzing) [Flavobacterium restrictum]|uniref:asparagine synthase (glutamine-hydrolyzing) n=1 Tax=Flavobacterium restrictum TaxID=2594428 RepID=A0A553E8L7_9FLAO|nr:asparagine synthase (glutamine-hydrolyzing) [Flavobacterium restrictum]TRX41251.1 asparagine synthase (glutamine-hydrolyzing) [Flavobacterium restrictum]